MFDTAEVLVVLVGVEVPAVTFVALVTVELRAFVMLMPIIVPLIMEILAIAVAFTVLFGLQVPFAIVKLASQAVQSV